MSTDQAAFSFELNESLYFERGQEVAEIMGISLDPEISIQSFNEYISIRGVIELHGDYQKVASADEEDDNTLDFDDFHGRNYVERVVDMVDGQAEFTHRFPVEISVPTYRVSDLDDVTVSIESFDYELPNQSQLNLSSVIDIHGISDEVENPELHDTTLETEMDEELSFGKRDEESTFQFEIKEEKEEESNVESDVLDLENTPVLPVEEDVELTAEESTETDRWKHKKSQTLAEFFKKEPSPESPSYDHPSAEYDLPSSSHMDEAEFTDLDESVESRSSETKVRYLSDMFRSNEEEEYTKMRLCIVQNKDTIETIANRYEITTLQLVNQNRLRDENISEGQLLYIPQKKK